MQTIFQSSRPSQKNYARKQLLWWIVSLLIIVVIIKFAFHGIQGFSVGFMLIYFLFLLTREVTKVLISSIEFNTDTKKIVYESRTCFTRPKRRSIKFENARMEIGKEGWRGKLVLYFLSDKFEVFTVSQPKDGFSQETLASIWKKAEEFSLPISKY